MHFCSKTKRLIWPLLFAALFLCLLLPTETEAASSETASLRIYSTTDLHGKSIRYNYDTGASSEGSLAQISTVIKNDKAKLTKNTATMLVDVGDTIFGFGTNGIVNGSIDGTEYMYSIMKNMGYDAMTIGNHEFDFGYDYLRRAISNAGLNDRMLVANMRNSKTGKYPWARTKLIKKKVVTTKGKKRTIRIGVIGVVTPSGMVNHEREKVTAYDIVSTVKNRAKFLKKKKKADIVVVLAHSGIGDKSTWVTRGEDVAYKLCFLKNVDVVCAGHSHVNYPGTDANVAQVYSYKKVNKTTGFVNGKILIQSADHGKALGISDLKIRFTKKGKVIVTPQAANVRKITRNDAEDPNVVAWNAPFDNKFRSLYNACIATAENSTNTYFGMIEDNAMMQLANEAKIAYGNKMIEQYAPRLSGLPVISDTSYRLTGAGSASNYAVTNEQLTMTDILNEQPWSRELAGVYFITGAQLKENLEWKASMFGNEGSGNYADSLLNLYAKSGYVPIINSTWRQWTNFSVFDGIEYEIDATVEPRYNLDGTGKIHDTRRIKNLTYNGDPVEDDQIFIWITSLATGWWMPTRADVVNQRIAPGTSHISDLIRDYISEQGKVSTISSTTDENWNVRFDESKQYIIKSSADAEDIALAKPWYRGVLAENSGYAYFEAAFSAEEPTDTAPPLLVLSNLGPQLSGDPIDVRVNASDRSQLESVLYLKGKYDASAPEWAEAETVTEGRFSVLENGLYSVRAEDKAGNAAVRYIDVQNIDPTVATAPIVNECTNLDNRITGSAYPNARVEVKIGSKTYTVTASADGLFYCEVPYLNVDDVVEVRQKDAKGRLSAYHTTTVLRLAANHPNVKRITNTQAAVNGVLPDDEYCKVAVLRGKTVYIPKGSSALFKKTALYKENKSRNVVEVKYKFSLKTGKFKLYVPNLCSGQTIYIYSFDWIHRVNGGEEYIVKEVAPNRPVVADVVAEENTVYGYIPENASGKCTVKVKYNGKTYTGKSNKSGSFSVYVPGLQAGRKITVVARKKLDGSWKTSRKTTAKVKTLEMVLKKNKKKVTFKALRAGDTVLSGQFKKKPGKYGTIFVNGQKSTLEKADKKNRFKHKLQFGMRAGTRVTVAVISRNSHGKIVAAGRDILTVR